jgi:hypothetical protein
VRIKAVLRDAEILRMTNGSTERVVASAEKNFDRVVNLSSLLKVMGLRAEDRLKLLEILDKSSMHIWLARDGDQHLIYLSKGGPPQDEDFVGYQWK